MMIAALITLFPPGAVPAPPKPGLPAVMGEAPHARFEAEMFALMTRIQSDPNYASIRIDREFGATAYFKGDAAARLAQYSRDPRVRAVPVPLSASELGEISQNFMFWVRSHGLAFDWAGADPLTGQVTFGSRNSEAVLAQARADKIDLRHIRIVDSTPRYGPERG